MVIAVADHLHDQLPVGFLIVIRTSAHLDLRLSPQLVKSLKRRASSPMSPNPSREASIGGSLGAIGPIAPFHATWRKAATQGDGLDRDAMRLDAIDQSDTPWRAGESGQKTAARYVTADGPFTTRLLAL